MPTPSPTPVPITELRLWHWPDTPAKDAHLQSLVAAFQQTEPTIAVEVVKQSNYTRRLRTALGNDRPPDVLYLNSAQLPDLIADGAVASLPFTVTNDTELYPHLRAAVQVDGHAYCAPDAFHTLALFYNQELFDTAAVPYPTAEWRWEDLRNAAEQLTNADSGQYGLVLTADLALAAVPLSSRGNTADGRWFGARHQQPRGRRRT
ncbi:MAG: extracellular solute-binding protein [Caldilineaceae bacterium]